MQLNLIKPLVLVLMCIVNVAMAHNDKKELQIIQLAETVYQYISYFDIAPYGVVGASGLVVIEGGSAYIIDTPWTTTDTEKLISWIKTKGLTIEASVITHFHEDASGGISLLNKLNIKTYATPLTNQLLKSNHRETTSDTIPRNLFTLVENFIETYYPGKGHSPDNIVVWLPKTKTLFGGCFIKSINSKNLGNTADASIESWPQSIENVLNQYPDIETVIPGHGKIGNKSLLLHTKKLTIANVGNEK